MAKRDLWRNDVSGSVGPWMSAAVCLVVALIAARFAPVPLLLTAGVLAAALLPRFCSLRTTLFWSLAVGSVLSLTPWITHSVAWRMVLVFNAAMLLATEIACEQGIGVPVLRFVRLPRVQAWATTVWASLWGVGLVLLVDDNIRRSSLSPLWRWVAVPLVLAMSIPLKRGGGYFRGVAGALALVGGIAFWFAQGQAKSAEAMVQTGLNAMLGLLVVDLAHQKWVGLRSSQPPSKPIRVHSRESMP